MGSLRRKITVGHCDTFGRFHSICPMKWTRKTLVRCCCHIWHDGDPLLVPYQPIEGNLEREGKLPFFYRRYVDDSLTIMLNIATASNFLDTFNKEHSSVKFTMETVCNGMLPFLGVQLLNRSPQIEKLWCWKPTNSSPLLRNQSHVDNRYKKDLLRTTLDGAHRLSSSWSHFFGECDRLKTVFSRLKYPKHRVSLAPPSKVSLTRRLVTSSSFCHHPNDRWHGSKLPFRDQISADIVRKQLKDLSLKVHTAIQPVFVSRKIEQELHRNIATNCKSAVCCL